MAGKQEGAKFAFGGELLTRGTPGFYPQPALFTEATNEMRLSREEIFGPSHRLSMEAIDTAIMDAPRAGRIAPIGPRSNCAPAAGFDSVTCRRASAMDDDVARRTPGARSQAMPPPGGSGAPPMPEPPGL